MACHTTVDPRFATRLRELRDKQNLSQAKLARLAYITKPYLCQLENGQRRPSVATAGALDKALGAGGALAAMVADTGPAGDQRAMAERTLRYHATESDTLATILEIGEADLNRRSILTAPFLLAALAVPSRDWLLASLESVTDDDGNPRRVGLQQVTGIRDMFALFQELDVMRGGGHARVALVEYLTNYVLPLARRDHSNEQVQLALYEAASEQAYLVGWMAYDDGLHGLAERYLIQSLRLAQASGNRMLGAHVLAGMSDQANLLGNPQEALMLARVGQRGIPVADSPACLADLQILEARALAALHERAAAAHAVALQNSPLGYAGQTVSLSGPGSSTRPTCSARLLTVSVT